MPIRYEKTGPIAVFTIDNGKHNVLTPAMHRELYQRLREFVIDPDIHVGILKGRDGGSFCAGDDIKTPLPERTRQQELEGYLFLHQNEGEQPHRPGWDIDILCMERYKPIIGAVDGYCLGQGMIYLLHLTDLRVATHRAQFGLPEIAYGMGGGGGVARIGRQLPHVVAMQFLLTGEPMTAQEALQYHLVNQVVPADQLMEAAMRLAGKVAAHPPVAVRVEMEAYQRSLDLSRSDALSYCNNLYRLQRMGYEGYGAGTGFLRRNARPGGSDAA